MLHVFPTSGSGKTGEPGVGATDVLWIDLLNPTSAEITNVEETVGVTLPSLEALNEIETSSRLRNHGGVLYMSTPSAARRPEGTETTPPLGIVRLKSILPISTLRRCVASLILLMNSPSARRDSRPKTAYIHLP